MLTAFLSVVTLATSMASTVAAIEPPSAEIRYDDAPRPVIATEINGKGPYYMVVDSAAETSLMVPALAKVLGLTSMDSGLTINGATGSVKANMYGVDEFKSPLFDVKRIGLLELPNPGSTRAGGIIGMNLFADKALVFDIKHHQLRTESSGAVAGKYLTIKAIKDHSQLLRIMVKLNGVDIPALIDTGAGASIANAAVMKALGWQASDKQLQDDGQIRGATQDVGSIKKATIASVKIDGIAMKDVPIRFNVDDKETEAELILGNDILTSLEGFALDFPKQEFKIKLPE